MTTSLSLTISLSLLGERLSLELPHQQQRRKNQNNKRVLEESLSPRTCFFLSSLFFTFFLFTWLSGESYVTSPSPSPTNQERAQVQQQVFVVLLCCFLRIFFIFLLEESITSSGLLGQGGLSSDLWFMGMWVLGSRFSDQVIMKVVDLYFNFKKILLR